LGDVSVKAGDLAGAKRYYKQSLTIARKLAKNNHTNARLQRDVWVSYHTIAAYQEKAGLPEAFENWQKCRRVFEGMIARGMHISPHDLEFLEWLRKKLGDPTP